MILDPMREIMSDLATTAQPAANAESPKRSPAREALLDLKTRIGKSVLGQDHMVESMLIGLLANGNLLIESLPGLAKTRAVKTLAKTWRRICRACSSRRTCCHRM